MILKLPERGKKEKDKKKKRPHTKSQNDARFVSSQHKFEISVSVPYKNGAF